MPRTMFALSSAVRYFQPSWDTTGVYAAHSRHIPGRPAHISRTLCRLHLLSVVDKPAAHRRESDAVNDPLLRNVLESAEGDDCEQAIAELLAEHVYRRVDAILATC